MPRLERGRLGLEEEEEAGDFVVVVGGEGLGLDLAPKQPEFGLEVESDLF